MPPVIEGLAVSQRSGLIVSYGSALVRACRIIDTVIIVELFLVLFSRAPIADGTGWFSDRPFWLDALVCVLILQVMGSFFRLGRSWRMIRLRYEFAELLGYWASSFAVLVAIFAFAGDLTMPEWRSWAGPVLLWFVASYLVMAGARGVVRMALRHYRARGNDLRAAAIIGSGMAARKLSETFRAQPWMGIRSIGVYDDDDDPEVVGTIEEAVGLALSGQIGAIYLALPLSAHDKLQTIVRRLEGSTVSIYYCPPVTDLGYLTSRYDDVFGQPVLSIVDSPFEGASGAIKRLEDLLICAVAAPILIVPGLLCALAVKLTSKGPVLFKQTRYGLDGRPFVIRKFRTMYEVETDAQYRQATRDDPRVTPVGRFLRKTSLDELPQFLNVLDGSMSVVGPRPHPIKLDEQFRDIVPRYMVRNKIKPGITGLAQVNGWRGETETVDKMRNRVQQDINYLRQWSLWLDVKILLKTLLVPFDTKGAY